ncbi:ABC transporter permease [Actinokineospora spheciospongiae]|uniref:ABC transporter permease n=1 Tax=Actinokineospora spheciospongiae TaxID=909613 RepID=UPI000D875AE8|nr:ABC transporter permease [Actinokineospora spheciospongiae]PWW63082.1 putative ABC transport system permease protein [Actinokineospora spheciospongiae]
MQSPWRAAPRAAGSSPLTVLVAVVAGLLLSFVGAAAVLHADSAGNAAIDYQAGRLCPQSVSAVFDGGGLTAAEAERVVDVVGEQARAAGAGTPLVALYSSVRQNDFDGKHPWSRFGYRDGAMDNVTVLEGGSRDGLWVPQSVARDGGITLGSRGLGGTLPPVTAIYADVADPVSDYWCTERQRIVPNPLAAEGATAAPIWFPDRARFATYLDREQAGGGAALSVRFPRPVPGTVDDAASVVAVGADLISRVRGALDAEGVGQTVTGSNYLAKPVEVAGKASSTVWSAVLPLTVISLLVGLAGVAAVTGQWCQRRQAELRLLWARGAGPAALGGRAVLELAAPLLVGAVAGFTLARVALSAYAPSPLLNGGTVGTALLLVAGVFLASLAVVAVVTGVRVHRTLQAPGGRNRARVPRWVPWELLAAVAAYLTWARVRSQPVELAFAQPLPKTAEAAGLAFPLLVVLTVALVAVRLARWGLAAAHRVRWWRVPAAQLAVRRLAAAAGSAVGILLVGVLAVGTLTVGVGVADAQDEALRTKSGLFVGAESVAQVPRRVAEAGLPADLAEHATVVGVVKAKQATVLLVDPATFTRGAWLGDRDAGQVAAALAELRPGQALRVGAAPGGSVELPWVGRVRTVAEAASFPLIGSGAGYVVTSVPDPRDVAVWQAWSAEPVQRLTAGLGAAGIDFFSPRGRAGALDGLPFLTVTWTFDFVTALGFVLAVVAAAALVLAVEVRRRQNALAGALATRMGLRRGALVLSHLVELGSLAGVSVLAGSAAGWVCAAVAAPLLDPSPWLRPIASAPDLLGLVGLTAGAAAAVVGLICLSAVRSVTTARVGELIRG